MLIDLRSKLPAISGKVVENALVKADITVNKNMIPYDTRSPFQTSGIRIGTPAITTRGCNENDIPLIVRFIDTIISNFDNEKIIKDIKLQVNEMMMHKPIFTNS